MCFQNSTRPPLKLSNVERITNFQILVLFGCLLAISLVCSIGQTIWKYQYGNDAWYMDLNCKSPKAHAAPIFHIFCLTCPYQLIFLSYFKLLKCWYVFCWFLLPWTKFHITSEICGNVGILQFPVNWDMTAVTCLDVFWCECMLKKWLNITALLYFLFRF